MGALSRNLAHHSKEFEFPLAHDVAQNEQLRLDWKTWQPSLRCLPELLDFCHFAFGPCASQIMAFRCFVDTAKCMEVKTSILIRLRDKDQMLSYGDDRPIDKIDAKISICISR